MKSEKTEPSAIVSGSKRKAEGNYFENKELCFLKKMKVKYNKIQKKVEETVSYTHLDVYKRQEERFDQNREDTNENLKRINEKIDSIKERDVYKRQP